MWVRDSFICRPLLWKSWWTPLFWLLHVCVVTHSLCGMTHSYVWRDSFTGQYSYVWCDFTNSHMNTVHHSVTNSRTHPWIASIIHCVAWLIYCRVFMCVSWLIHCVAWLIHMCGVTHSYVWNDSLIFLSCLIHMSGIPHSRVWHYSWWRIHTCDRLLPTETVRIWDMNHPYLGHDLFICAT